MKLGIGRPCGSSGLRFVLLCAGLGVTFLGGLTFDLTVLESIPTRVTGDLSDGY